MTIRNAFWLLVIGMVWLLGFFVLTGSWDPASAPAAAAVMGGLCALWAAHAAVEHRRHAEIQRDPRMRADRERRGF
jgi:hypothetical protein